MGLNIVVISLAVSMVQGLIVDGFGEAHLHTHGQTISTNKNTLKYQHILDVVD